MRQEMAATVNNQFQYHRDQNKEQQMILEKETFKNLLIIAIIICAMVILASLYWISIRKNKHLKEMLRVSTELNGLINDKKEMQNLIDEQRSNLQVLNGLLNKSVSELTSTKSKLDTINEELRAADEELESKEKLLSEKMEQNHSLLNLLHQSELTNAAEDVILSIRQSSNGKKTLSQDDWIQLYMAIDKLYPSFKDQMLKELGTFTEQQMQVCYLIRSGLTKRQIQNITNLSRVTVWRWEKKFSWILLN